MTTTRTSKTTLLTLCAAFAISGNVMAQGLPAGSGTFYPGIDFTAFHDDNLLRSDTNELGTLGWTASPYLGFELRDNTKNFLANWRMDAGFYDDSSDDDYLDNTLNATFEIYPTNRFTSAFTAEYMDSHDPRGTGRAEGVIVAASQVEPDEWHHYLLSGSLAYGAKDATGRYEGDVGYVEKRYDNNLESTIYRNRDDTTASARFFYRVAPATSVLLEGRIADFDYQVDSPLETHGDPAPSLNSQVYKLFGGLAWEATEMTSGSIKLGYIAKDFDNEARPDNDGFAWEVNVLWSPKTYSTVNLFTTRDYMETNGAGNYIESDTVGVSWTHYWLNHVNTVVDLSFANDSFAPTTRKDDRMNAGIALNYQARKWATFGISYSFEDRDSNRDTFDFERNLFMISALFAL